MVNYYFTFDKIRCLRIPCQVIIPKSEIDFMQIGVSYYFRLKKQSKDQKYVSPLTHCTHLFIFMTIRQPQHVLWAHQST